MLLFTSTLARRALTIVRSPRNERLFLFLTLALGLPAFPVQALPSFPPIVVQTYHPKAGGTVEQAVQNCVFCHAPSGPPKLNPFGQDVKEALKAQNTKDLTSAVLKSIESKDSDGDGFSNGAEIAADKLPGDPNSKPAGIPQAKASDAGGSAQNAPAASGGGFDLKTLLFPRHGQHPALIHFPIGLFLIGLLFDILGTRKQDKSLLTAGYFNLLAAALSAPFALGTGLVAWFQLYGLSALRTNTSLQLHLILAVASSLAMGFLLWQRRRQSEGVTVLTNTYFAIAVLTALALALVGHLGGNLSGVNG